MAEPVVVARAPAVPVVRAAAVPWLRTRLADRALGVLCGAAALVAVGLLVGLASVLLSRAGDALSLSLVTQEATAAGAGGGLRWQLVGTVLLACSALAVALPLGTAAGLALGVYLPPGRRRRVLELALYTANGVPSILFGIFALALFTHHLGWGKSWLAGGIVLGMMTAPAVALALGERIAALPPGYLLAARALGLGRDRTVWRVVLPQCRGGLVSAALLGIARAAGETAPILFAAAVFAGATLPSGVVESPVLALPYHVFVLAQDSFDPGAEARLWAAGWLLLALGVGFSLLALPVRLRAREEAHAA